MSTSNVYSERRLYRDKDRAMLGGVCAGLADYLGFNLCVTRFLAFVAFLTVMPIAVIGYLAAVFLIPAASSGKVSKRSRRRASCCRRSRREAVEDDPPSPSQKVSEQINARCKELDERLAKLEKRVTSPRFQLEQELAKL